MSTLTKDTPRAFELNGGDPQLNEVPIIASDTVFAGAAVGESSSAGTGRPLVGGDNFMGFSTEKCDNEGGSAGAKLIKVRKAGVVWLTVTNGDNINDYSDTVYAVDDNTFTMVASGASSIGKLIRYDSASGKCLVQFEAVAVRSI